MNDGLGKIWWLWLPLAFAVVQAILEMTIPGDTLSILLSENGPHELAQFFVMLAAFVIAVKTLVLRPWKIAPWLGGWVALAAVCCLYVAGEELSWGQQILNWDTPEYWHAVNDQGETNLHNTSSWFDQKPRLILLLGAFTGSVLFPLLQKYKPGALPPKYAIVYPPVKLGVIAALAVGINLLSKVDDVLKDVVIMTRASEVEELYLYYFVLLYVIVLRRRIQAKLLS